MLEVQKLRDNWSEVSASLAKRGVDFTPILTEIIQLDDQRKSCKAMLDNANQRANQMATDIGKLMQEGKTAEAEPLKAENLKLKQAAQEAKDTLAKTEDLLLQALCKVPNAPHQSVVFGKTAEENVEVYRHEVELNLPKSAKPHWDLIQDYKLIDFELGVKVTGAGFPFYMGKGAKLQRALIAFFLDRATAAGYTEVLPPHLVNEASGFGTGQLPDKEGQMYHATVDNLYLIPTAEVPVTNIWRDVIVKEEELPIKYTAYSPCFRREAGSWGAHVRGLNRLHQFDKVEIVQATTAENSYQVLETMVEHVKSLLHALNLPFRIVRLCGGDMGFSSALTYDFEVYSAAQARWLEVSSTSNFETFQANRLKFRYKDKQGKIQLSHTLNGSAMALPRIVAALLENNQTENGIAIPAVLQSYTGFDKITL
jgi:seryl-tRNA synthetase